MLNDSGAMNQPLHSVWCIVHCININRICHLITHVLIQGMGDVFCVYEGIERQNTGIICNILPIICKKLNIYRHFAEWELSQSSLFASNPGHFFSKAPAVSAKMHPIVDVYCNRPQ